MLQKFDTYVTPMGRTTTIHLYLPDGWMLQNKSYPVLYMYDGHNLFFDSDATYGKSWGLKDWLDTHGQQWIVVGMECDHTGNNRLSEYCPYDLPTVFWGGVEGKGEQFMNWVVNELKPQIDAAYPTLPDRAHTAIAGSSMGGLMSLYSVCRYNEVFSKAACLSPSVRLCPKQMMDDVTASAPDKDTRVFISWGSDESRDKGDLATATAKNLEFSHVLLEKGVSVYPYLHVGGSHCEACWEQEIPLFMDFLWKE